jgi:UDP-N-acetylmuramoyl-L-alanyl-D-glutamate--2,6-diaminopimelate ligase
MKLLKDILYGVRIAEVFGSTNVAIEDVTANSREVKPFGLYVAIPGVNVDGHRFIDEAVKSGALAIVAEKLPNEAGRKSGVTYIRVKNTRLALGPIASSFYGNPSETMSIVAVTGTNGKTTVATLLHRLFRSMDRTAGLFSTVENRILDEIVPSTHTTPDAVQLQRTFRAMADAGCKYVFMEASSHSIDQHRLAGTALNGAIFTNITHEHLDYHGSFNAYITAKKGLFDELPADAFALVNGDDSHAQDMLAGCKAKRCDFALSSMADYRARLVENSINGMQLFIDGHDLYSQLAGKFNASNLIAVYGTARELGFETVEILTHLSILQPPSGRFERIEVGGFTAIVDFAHTPDALKNVLQTLGQFKEGAKSVITVVGCGGDRDRTKRPLMAGVAADLSDRIFFTSDNPRSEDPEQILADMRASLDPIQARKCVSIASRREAIRMAVQVAKAGDLILLAGKGHETYQEIQGVKHEFDDRTELLRAAADLQA